MTDLQGHQRSGLARDEGLPREARLRRRAEFLVVQQLGKRAHTRHFVVITRARERPDTTTRIGVTVTKRVANAVGRNRVKRVVREVFRRNRALFPAGRDVVIIAKSGAPLLGYDQARAEIAAIPRRMLCSIPRTRSGPPTALSPKKTT